MITNVALGVLASIIAGIALLLVTNQEDVRYLRSARKRYRHFQASWKHYRLTIVRGSAEPTWVQSDLKLELNLFGRLRGESTPSDMQDLLVRAAGDNRGSSAPRATELSSYFARGTVRNGVMRLRLDNVSTEQEPISLVYPIMHQKDLLGIWLGQDDGKTWTTSPSILSRDKLTDAHLDSLAEAQVSLSRTTTRYSVRFYPGEQSSTGWSTQIGKKEVEHLGETDSHPRCILSGQAHEDGTAKLVFGPYKTLPFLGRYMVTWYLALECPPDLPSDNAIARLDVYGDGAALETLWLRKADACDGKYRRHVLVFHYTDPSLILEYRVALLKAGVSARLYDITVERPAPELPRG